jgi:RHS repeat-associated protein
VIERYAYTPYGEMVVLDAAGAPKALQQPLQPYGYTGRRYDSETGLWYFRNRYFDSGLGRFISRDPKGYVDGFSEYRAYFSPLGLDPFGLRDVTAKEQESLDLLEELAKAAEAKGDAETAKSIREAKSELEDSIARSPDLNSDTSDLKLMLYGLEIWSLQAKTGEAKFTKKDSASCPGYDDANPGEYKCNYYLMTVWVTALGTTPIGHGAGSSGRHVPPRAADWRSHSTPSLSGLVRPGGQTAGNVVNFVLSGNSDHVGICIGGGLYVSARSSPAGMPGDDTVPPGWSGPINPPDGVQVKKITSQTKNYMAPTYAAHGP